MRSGVSGAIPHHAPLPMALALVPGKQPVSKTVVDETRQRQDSPVAEEPRKPRLAGRDAPDGDRNVGADDQTAALVGRMQPAPDIVERSTEACQRIGLLVDVAKGDAAGA